MGRKEWERRRRFSSPFELLPFREVVTFRGWVWIPNDCQLKKMTSNRQTQSQTMKVIIYCKRRVGCQVMSNDRGGIINRTLATHSVIPAWKFALHFGFLSSSFSTLPSLGF